MSCALRVHAGFSTSGLIERTTFMKNFCELWEFQMCFRSFCNIFKREKKKLSIDCLKQGSFLC